MASLRLFAYKQTHDTGFAPNPFHGFLTLATCKPEIRRCKHKGDWIAGFTSTGLTKGGTRVGEERLIYLMRVGEVVPLEQYFADPRFAAKRASRPEDVTAPCVCSVGDNIYELRDGQWIQYPNRSHGSEQILKDTRGRNALISTEFFYFGCEPLIIPGEIRPTVPAGQSAHGVQTKDLIRAQAFIDYVRSRGPGIHARPHQWKTGDESWRQP
jgi:hypothetical protein